MPEVFLKVDSAYPEDQGAGKVRLDPETMLQLRLSPGNIVYIEGKRRTVAKVWRSMVSDWHQGKVRVDNFTRANAGISIGDRVKVVAVEEEVEAKRVILAPPEDMPRQIPINYTGVVNRLIDFPVVKNDLIPIPAGLPFMQAQLVAFKAVAVEPENAIIITKNTQVEFSDKPATGFEGLKKVSYEDIGGLKDELQRVRETIELPMRHPELFRKLGIEPPKGVLLYGPPGTGKTLIAKAVANESGAHFIPIAGPEIISKYYGESEQKLREIFEEARQNAPSIIFIDELDSIAPRREDVTGEVERRVVAQLLTMMDGLEERGQVVVIGATNRVDAIDPALRRPGRFDREIEIGVPNEVDRSEILKIHTRGMPVAKDVELPKLSQQTHGFVGADLAALAREGAIRALRRYLPDIDLEADEIPAGVLDRMEVLASDFREALRDVGPSAMREVFLEVPHIYWNDVGGLESEKEEVREAVEYPLTQRDKFDEIGISPPKGVLLYGPPGTGKTLIAKAVATESGANFIPVRGPQLLSKWVGESERAVREIFKKARQVAPSIIFFDELDALAPMRGGASDSHVIESVLNQILTEMDGLLEIRNVAILAATNRPDIIDPALLRAGRFDRLVYIGEPNDDDRNKILQIHTKFMPIRGTIFENVLDVLQFANRDQIGEIIDRCGTNKIVEYLEIEQKALQWKKTKSEEELKARKISFKDFSLDEFVKLTYPLQISDLIRLFDDLEPTQAINWNEFRQVYEKLMQKIIPEDEIARQNVIINNLIQKHGLILTDLTLPQLIFYLPYNNRDYLESIFKSLAQNKKIHEDIGQLEISLNDIRAAIAKSYPISESDSGIIREELKKLKLKPEGLTVDELVLFLRNIPSEKRELYAHEFKKVQNISLSERIDLIQDMKNKNIAPLTKNARRRIILSKFELNSIQLNDPVKKDFISRFVLLTKGFVGADLENLCREAGMIALRENASLITEQHFETVLAKIHPTMNERSREYYRRIREFFKGGLPKEVQPPEYQ